MTFKKLILLASALTAFSTIFIGSAFAESKLLRAPVSVNDFEDVKVASLDNAIPQPVNCYAEMPKKPIYESSLISVRRQLKVNPGEKFRVKVFLRNKGNMYWVSDKSPCLGPHMSLGTTKEKDRESWFFS